MNSGHVPEPDFLWWIWILLSPINVVYPMLRIVLIAYLIILRIWGSFLPGMDGIFSGNPTAIGATMV